MCPRRRLCLQAKSYRVYLGTGDRFNLSHCDGGSCDPYNYRACVRKGCSVRHDYFQELEDRQIHRMRRQITQFSFIDSNSSPPSTGADACDRLYLKVHLGDF